MTLTKIRTWSSLAQKTSCAEFGECTSNISRATTLAKTTFVTFNTRLRSPGHNLILHFPRLSPCPEFGEANISQNIYQKYSYTNDLRDLENSVKVTQFKLGLHIALALLCTKFDEDTSINS